MSGYCFGRDKCFATLNLKPGAGFCSSCYGPGTGSPSTLLNSPVATVAEKRRGAVLAVSWVKGVNKTHMIFATGRILQIGWVSRGGLQTASCAEAKVKMTPTTEKAQNHLPQNASFWTNLCGHEEILSVCVLLVFFSGCHLNG